MSCLVPDVMAEPVITRRQPSSQSGWDVPHNVPLIPTYAPLQNVHYWPDILRTPMGGALHCQQCQVARGYRQPELLVAWFENRQLTIRCAYCMCRVCSFAIHGQAPPIQRWYGQGVACLLYNSSRYTHTHIYVFIYIYILQLCEAANGKPTIKPL